VPSHAPIYDTFNVQPRLISRPGPRPALAKVREAVLTVTGGVKQVSFVLSISKSAAVAQRLASYILPPPPPPSPPPCSGEFTLFSSGWAGYGAWPWLVLPYAHSVSANMTKSAASRLLKFIASSEVPDPMSLLRLAGSGSCGTGSETSSCHAGCHGPARAANLTLPSGATPRTFPSEATPALDRSASRLGTGRRSSASLRHPRR
jgi:hypothetical protein